MIIYPAIDLREGTVVRLRKGDPNQQSTYSADPTRTAAEWRGLGASWIHMVNLDGAFATANSNERVLEEVARSGIKVQFGGGLRSMTDIERAMALGAARIVLGTAAVSDPDLVARVVERWGADCICVALDARNGQVTTHGWTESAGITPVELGLKMVALGVRHALYTDVARDGEMSGVDLEGTRRLAEKTGLEVIASGGLTTLDEIAQLSESGVVAGAVIGKALYEGRLSLKDALRVAGGQGAG